MVKKLLLLVVLSGTTNSLCMEKIFKQDDKCKIIAGPYKSSDSIVTIEGTAQDMWGVDTIETLVTKKPSLLGYSVLAAYFGHCAKQGVNINKFPNFSIDDLKEDHKGIFYYGELERNGYCFHQSWLEKIKDNAS